MKAWILRLLERTASVFYLQLFISICCLPLIVSWGLEISLLSILGNILFSPLITVFLLLSSLLFFAALLNIPCSWLGTFLSLLCKGWLWVMSWSSTGSLIALPKPCLWLALMATLGAVAIIHCKRIRTTLAGLAALSSIVALVALLSLPSTARTCALGTIACKKHTLSYLYKSGTVTVIDTGVIASNYNTASWLEYTLMPELIKQTGCNTITCFMVIEPSERIFTGLAHLITLYRVREIVLPFWKTEHIFLNRAYIKLKRTAAQHGTTLTFLKDKKRVLEHPYALAAERMDDSLDRNGTTFDAYCLHAWIDKQEFAFYPAHHRTSLAKKGSSHGTKSQGCTHSRA